MLNNAKTAALLAGLGGIIMAIAAATDVVRMSRLRTWEISWASTPWISSHERRSIKPWLTHTAAWAGLRPVAKAFGWGLGAT